MSVSVPIHQPSAAAVERCLLLGLCGAGMTNLCQLLLARGQQVTGSDTDSHLLQTFAVAVPSQRQVTTVDWTELYSLDFRQYSRVIRSLAVPADLPIFKIAVQSGCRIQTLPEALADCCRGTPQYCVAGTHGKTTTSGMLWWLLQHSGRRTGRYVGGDFQLPRQPEHISGPAEMVLESCEYRDSFLTLSPDLAILTGIEPDHLDWLADTRSMLSSYTRFLSGLSDRGGVIVNAACRNACTAVRGANRRTVAVVPRDAGSGAGFVEYWEYSPAGSRSHFSRANGGLPGQQVLLRHSSGEELLLRLPLPGRHNMLNAAMALAAGCELGLSPAAAARGLADFPGMQRRLEFRGTWRGADLFDDYAHHPTAASAVLSTLASCFPGRRIVGVFEPHQCSRLRGLMSEFSEALRLADELYVLPALRIRESASAEESAALSGELVQLIRNLGGRAKLVSDLDRVTGILDDAVRPGDIVITMGAGRTNTIHDQIIRRIQRDSAA